MSYKPPGPEEMAGPTGVGPRDRGLVRRSFRIILGSTISLALLVLFLATAAMAWIVLFSGPSLQFRSLGRGYVAEVLIPKDCVDHIERLQLVKGDDGEVIWDIAAGEESIILTVLRFTLDGNLVLPDPTSDAAVLAPTTGTTFDLDPGTRYTLTMWGDEKAKRHCSSKGSFSLTGETPPTTAAAPCSPIDSGIDQQTPRRIALSNPMVLLLVRNGNRHIHEAFVIVRHLLRMHA